MERSFEKYIVSHHVLCTRGTMVHEIGTWLLFYNVIAVQRRPLVLQEREITVFWAVGVRQSNGVSTMQRFRRRTYKRCVTEQSKTNCTILFLLLNQ
jgi:hypothetical protein